MASDSECADMIACVLVQKFRLRYVKNGVVDCDTEYTQMLMDSIGSSFILRANPPGRFSLKRTLLTCSPGAGS